MNTARLGLLLFCLSWLKAYAQTATIEYFDALDRSEGAKSAVYYRKISKPDSSNIYLGVEYWMDGHIKAVGQSLDAAFFLKTGKFTKYYENGNKSEEGQYYADVTDVPYSFRNQKWECWYADGKLKEVWVYKITDTKDIKSVEGYLMSFWDSLGVQKVTKGEGWYHFSEKASTVNSNDQIMNFEGQIKKGQFEGLWKGFYNNGKIYSEDNYLGDSLIGGTSFDIAGNKYTYDKKSTKAHYPGGEDGLRAFLKMNLNDLSRSFRNSSLAAIYSGVVVKAYVDFNGHIQKAEISRGNSPIMDEEALRVVKSIKKIVPATFRGQPIESYLYLPINFY